MLYIYTYTRIHIHASIYLILTNAFVTNLCKFYFKGDHITIDMCTSHIIYTPAEMPVTTEQLTVS